MISHVEHPARRWWIRCLAATLFLGSWIGLSGMAWGQIVRVEEDWEMVVSQPDPDTDGPQITCIISPAGGTAGIHANFDINLRSLPHFAPGGLEMQLWYGECPIYQSESHHTAVMSTPGEIVRWTQSMHVDGGLLVFEVLSGSSTTWGSFGGLSHLRVMFPTAMDELSGYSPDASVANSGIGYAGNRVESLVLRRVRLITAQGEVHEDDMPRYVHAE